MTTNFGSSRSLLKPRAVRADAALGTNRSRAIGAVKRLSPTDIASRAGNRRFPLAAPSWPESVPRPAPEHRLGVDYDTDWSRKYPVRLVRAMLLDNVTRPLARLIADPLVRGDEYLATLDAPVIFAANHTSHVDTPLLMSCLPLRFRHRTVVAAAADYFFDRRWKSDLFAFSLGAIPIERNKVNRRSAQLAADLVEDGWNLIIFPEGGRSPDGWGQIYRGGAAYLSVRTGRPVVPVHLQGTGNVLPKGGRGIRRTRTTVTFGTPLLPDEGEDARRFGARIESAVATLADEATTDWWTARRRAVAGTTPRLQGPDVAPWRRSWALPKATSATPNPNADVDGTGWPRRTGTRSQ